MIPASYLKSLMPRELPLFVNFCKKSGNREMRNLHFPRPEAQPDEQSPFKGRRQEIRNATAPLAESQQFWLAQMAVNAGAHQKR